MREGLATGTTTTPRFKWLKRLFGHIIATSNPPHVPPASPALHFATEWIAALGGRVEAEATDLVRGTLPDGRTLAYTNSPQRAAQDADLEVLAPAFPALRTLLLQAGEYSSGLVLSMPPGPHDPGALAREAVSNASSRGKRSRGLTHARDAQEDRDTPGEPSTSREPLSLLIDGIGKVRSCEVRARTWRIAHEFTLRLSVASLRGRRAELVRVAIDAETGSQIAALDPSLLHAARAYEETEQSAELSRGVSALAEHLRQALVVIEPATQAAGRLARMRLLPAYQEQQDLLEMTFRHQLLEAPEQAQILLDSRAHALERLAFTYAVEVQVDLLNVVTLISQLAHMRLTFAGGGELTLAVDTSRGDVSLPLCIGCGRAWRIGARCASGHVTCRECQRDCVHCGVRSCIHCAVVPRACDVCGGLACARCAGTSVRQRRCPASRTTAKGNGQAGEDNFEPIVHRDRMWIAAQAGAYVRAGADDSGTHTRDQMLRVQDVEGMLPSTWDDMVLWLAEGMGLRPLERSQQNIEGHSLLCAVVDCAQLPDGIASLTPGALVAVWSYRPGLSVGSLRETYTALREAIARGRSAGAVLVTTRVADVTLSAMTPGAAGRLCVEVLDRPALDRLLRTRGAAHRTAQSAADEQMERRALAASHVRTVLIAALRETHDQLAVLPTQVLPARTSGGAQTSSAATQPLSDVWSMAQQALAAIETLIDEWERAFADVPTRMDTQEIVTDESELAAMAERALHLGGVLRDVRERLTSTGAAHASPGAWDNAVRQQIAKHCSALALRCEALNPGVWRTFEQVRDATLAAASVEESAASSRASMRARKLAQGTRKAPTRQSMRE